MSQLVERVHSIFLDLGVSIPLEDLRNPSEAFMINIISEFFHRFNIDVAAIKRTTLEQNSALRVTNPENANIASIINLREAMFVIGHKIFIPDFSINDLSSPAPKRTLKHLKLIANFLLYARARMSSIREGTNEVLVRGNHINDLRKKKQSIIEETHEKAAEISRKKMHKEKLIHDIEMIRERIEKKRSHMGKLDVKCKDYEEKKQQIIERNRAKIAGTKKLEEIIIQLKGKVVQEPESIKLRLQELETEFKNKKERRAVVQESIQKKNPMIQNVENALAYVEKQRIKLPEVIDLQKKLIERNQKRESLKRQEEEVIRLIQLEMDRDHEDEEKVTDEEVKKCEANCQEKLSKLRNLNNELIIEKKGLERKMMNTEEHAGKLCMNRNKIRDEISETESEIRQFLQQCQELLNKEIKDMETLHEFTDDQINLLRDLVSDSTEI